MEITFKNNKFIIETDDLGILGLILKNYKKEVKTNEEIKPKKEVTTKNVKRKVRSPHASTLLKEFTKNNPTALPTDCFNFLISKNFSKLQAKKALDKVFK